MKKISKANEKRKRGKSKKRAKDEEVNGQGGKWGRGCPSPMQAVPQIIFSRNLHFIYFSG